jgi:proteasome lid subunit RPN8/RPN11
MPLIQREILEKIRSHAKEEYPNECCGVLLGNAAENVVKAAVLCQNVRSEQTRYEIDARELVRIQREARENGHEIVGFYHSHPDHPATWSATDLAEAHWIGCSYVIVSVNEGEAAEVRSFRLSGRLEEDKRFEVEDISEF